MNKFPFLSFVAIAAWVFLFGYDARKQTSAQGVGTLNSGEQFHDVGAAHREHDENPSSNELTGGRSALRDAQELKLDSSAQIGEYVREVFEDRKGNLWFGTLVKGVCRFDEKSLTYFTTEQGLAGNQINGIAEDAMGNLWFATTEGVSKYDGTSFTNFTEEEGLIDNSAWSILADSKGNIWVGTLGGVCRYQGASFSRFPIPKANVKNPTPKFSTDLVWSIMEDSKGNIWFGTDGVGVCKYDGSAFSHFTKEDGLCNNNARQILEDKKGDVWFASWGSESGDGGVSRFDGTSVTTFYPEIEGLSSSNVSPIFEDKTGKIWIASMNNGAYRYDGEKLESFNETDRQDLTRNFCVQSILEDRNGTLWFGFSGGLFRFNAKSFVNVTQNGPWRVPVQKPLQKPAPDELAGPMASFARMETGEWRVTFLSGTSMFDTWQWGPGKFSMLAQTYGFGAAGEPWRGLDVYYWHPARQQVCLLGLSPFARGVSEGTIKFEGETADAVFDLHQTGGPRKMGLRWTFDGPNKYHATLLEDTGAGLRPLNELDYVRSEKLTQTHRRSAEQAPKPSARLKVLESLLGHTWEAKGDWATGDTFHVKTKFEWVPYADAIYTRVLAPTKKSDPLHVLDAYFYHHTGANALRCLALSNQGGMYEGDLAVLEGGALQLDLKGYEGDRAVQRVVRFDFEKEGSLRNRVWNLEGTKRTLILDVQHKRLEPKND